MKVLAFAGRKNYLVVRRRRARRSPSMRPATDARFTAINVTSASGISRASDIPC